MSNSPQEFKVRAVLLEAKNALIEELQAAGIDEVEQHPTLKRHSDIVDHITAVLEEYFW